MKFIYHYCGHIVSNNNFGRFPYSNEGDVRNVIDEYFKELDVVSCYGSLASGADIMLAESMVRNGAMLNIILPFNQVAFIKSSVENPDEKWKDRFQRLRGKAHSITQVFYKKPEDEAIGFSLCTVVAMGLSLLEAMKKKYILKQQLRQISVWDHKELREQAGTYHDMLRWNVLGLTTTYISSKQPIMVNNFDEAGAELDHLFSVIIYDENDSGNSIRVCTLGEFIIRIESRPYNGNYLVDLDHEIFGKIESKFSGRISKRALGLISYYCCLDRNLISYWNMEVLFECM